jgi:hypothetical protein
MKINEINAPVLPDTYEASMFLSQAIRAGKYAIQIHNVLKNEQEVESWVQKKIDLATAYINSVANYLETQQVHEDAGEGHMAKSQLYSAAKSAIKITQMVRPGDDIEAWVQTKMNRAVDMLDAVYHYEDYQRLNPYREQLDSNVLQRHSQIVQKNIDEILARETPANDTETKPGMLNILKKRVHEVEKKMCREYSKEKPQRQLVDPDKEVMVQKDGKVITIDKSQEKEYLDKGWTLAENTISEDPRAVGQALANIKYGKEIANAILQGTDIDILKSKAKAYLSSIDDTLELLNQMYPSQYRSNESALAEIEMRGNPHTVLGKAEAYLNYGISLAQDIKAGKMQDAQVKAEMIMQKYPEVITAIKELYPKNESVVAERMPAQIIKNKQRLAMMTDKELADRFRDTDETTLRQMAWRHGYGKMSSHYWDRVQRGLADTHDDDVLDTEFDAQPRDRGQRLDIGDSIEEGLGDWAKKLAAAGIIVGTLAGIGSINYALDNSVPVIQAMKNAKKMAIERGDTDLAQQILQDIKGAQVRLSSGKDLNQIKYLQDKYSKFMPTEGIAYESKLAILLNQRLK